MPWNARSSSSSTVNRRRSSPRRGSGMTGSSIPAIRARCWDSASRPVAKRTSARSTPRASAWLACEGCNMIYSEQHRELMRSVTKFCESEINPHVDEWEQAGIFPAHELFKKMGSQGFLGIHKPETFGGLGVSEVGAGYDVASIKTRARKDGGDYVIDGGKMWTTNGTQADWMCHLCNTGEGAVHRNKSLICVPMKTKGVQVARKLDKLGMRASDTAQIFFDGVR